MRSLWFLGGGRSYADALDDLSAIYQWLQAHASPAAFLFAWLAKIKGIAWMRAFLEWINPRRHARKRAWSFAILTGFGLGALAVLAEIAAEGMPGRQVILLVLAVFIGMEGVGVLTGYLLLNRFLGILLN